MSKPIVRDYFNTARKLVLEGHNMVGVRPYYKSMFKMEIPKGTPIDSWSIL